MAEQFGDNQYDDDLTVGANEFDDFSSAGAVDLFEFSTEEESPISRLKSLILSIDWEITDDILVEFNEELVDLQDVWASEKINLVYLQALGKISKYIYQHKVSSHPNAIKLLLILYYNLEKIVSSDNLTPKQQQDILFEDVKRFENLKRQIAQKGAADDILRDGDDEHDSLAIEPKKDRELLQLKATVLGIDWEVTEQDLSDLRQEVIRLEEKYAESRPKLILLQGLGTLGAYIKAKKSSAHGDAFKLLHLFFESLEKMVITPMSLEEEKIILFPVVEKFNTFKMLLGSLSSSDSDSDSKERGDSGHSSGKSKDIQPAFANIPEQGVRGFQEDKEARRLGLHGSADVASHIDTFFGDDAENVVELEAENLEQVPPEADAALSLEQELALQGVNVETEADDDPDEEALPVEESGKLAPALAFGGKDEASLYSSDSLEDSSMDDGVGELVAETLDGFFVDDQEESVETVVELQVEPEVEIDLMPAAGEEVEPSAAVPDDTTETADPVLFALDRELAMQGVHVETEADDDSDEELLPTEQSGKLAPALAFGDTQVASLYSADALAEPSLEEGAEGQIAETLDDFFVDEELIVGVEEVVDDELIEVSLENEVEDVPLVDPIVVEEEQLDPLPAEVESADISEGFEEPEFVEEIAEEVITSEIASDLTSLSAMQMDEQETEKEELPQNEVETDKVVDTEDELVVFELVTSSVEGEKHDSLSALGVHLDSIGLELGDEIFEEIYQEIDQLHHHWQDKSLEKSFVLMISTVVKYVDRYRFESDPESYGLLKSNYDALSSLEEGMAEQNQELLFDEMSKVMQWQQDLLIRNIGISKGDGGMISPDEDPVKEDVQNNEHDDNREALQSEVTTLEKELEDKK